MFSYVVVCEGNWRIRISPAVCVQIATVLTNLRPFENKIPVFFSTFIGLQLNIATSLAIAISCLTPKLFKLKQRAKSCIRQNKYLAASIHVQFIWSFVTINRHNQNMAFFFLKKNSCYLIQCILKCL